MTFPQRISSSMQPLDPPALPGSHQEGALQGALQEREGSLNGKRVRPAEEEDKVSGLVEKRLRTEEAPVASEEEELNGLVEQMIRHAAKRDEARSIYGSIKEVNRRERQEVVHYAESFLNYRHSTVLWHQLIDAFGKIPHEERREVAVLAHSLLRRAWENSSASYVIEALGAISQEKRRALHTAFEGRLSSIGLGCLRAHLLKLVVPYDGETREKFFDLLLALVKKMTRNYFAFMTEIEQVDPAQRIGALTDAMALFPYLFREGGTSFLDAPCGKEAGEAVHAVAELPSAMKTYLLSHPQLVQGIKGGCRALLEELSRIGLEPLEGAIHILPQLFDGIISWGHNRAALLGTIFALEADVRQNVIQQLVGLLPVQRASVAPNLHLTEREERGEVLQYALPLVLHSEAERDEIDGIFGAIRELSSEQRVAILSDPEVDGLQSLLDAIDRAREEEEASDAASDGDGDIASYPLEVSPVELERSPELYLEALVKEFRAAVTTLSISYVNQPGIDAGGPGRQFISDLFLSLIKRLGCKEIGQSGLYHPTLHFHVGRREFAFEADERLLYNQWGKLMMFCLNATTREYPTGIFFDQGVFSALLSFPERLLDSSFDELNPKEVFSELLRIYGYMNQDVVHHMTKHLGALPAASVEKRVFLQELYSLVEYEESIQALQIAQGANVEPYLPQLQEALRQVIFRDVLRPNLAPLHEMARGMRQAPFANRCSWRQFRTLSPSQVSHRLQGENSPQMMIDKLQMDQAIPEAKRRWLKNWILTTSYEKRVRLIYAITGSRALGSKNIKVVNAPNATDPIYFHSCFNGVDIPFSTMDSEAQFKKTLEDSIKDVSYNRS